MPSQKSLEDQLDDLEALAAKNGLYDAQDWLRQVRESRAKERAEGLQRSFRIKDDDQEYNWCRVCDADWDIGQPEKHKPECPVAPPK